MANDKLFNNLNHVFNNSENLLESATLQDIFNEEKLLRMLATALKYYISTRDEQVFSLQRIQKEYNVISNYTVSGIYVKNIITNGFLTHSFNGIEKDYISKYGLNYSQHLTDEEKRYFRKTYEKINILEDALDKNGYINSRELASSKDIVSQEMFFTFPGAKSIYYATIAPERLYMGPLSFEIFPSIPIVVGETKQEYLLRTIRYKLSFRKYMDEANERFLYIARDVLEKFTASNAGISFVNINDVKDLPFSSIFFSEGDISRLKQFLAAVQETNELNGINTVFTRQLSDNSENYIVSFVSNLVTLASYLENIPTSIIDFPDIYSLKQEYDKRLGYGKGKIIDYTTCCPVDKLSERIKKLY